MERCALCRKPLRKPEAQEKGVGPICERKLTPEALRELQRAIKEGLSAQITANGVIQLTI